MTNNNLSILPRGKNRLRAAVAAVIGAMAMAAYTPQSFAAAAEVEEEEEVDASELEEVVVTGSRIVRRDLQTNSPLLTIDIQQFEDNTFISVEEALNDLPQFMAGGAQMSSGAVTGLQAANGLDG